MARYPKYYIRPDGLHETILRINGKRKAFRGKTDKEVWEKVKAFDREQAKQEAMEIKKTYEDNMLQANAKANEILTTAQKTATERSDKIIGEAQQAAAQIKSKASADIAQEKKKAINDAKNEISGLALAIAGKVVEKELAEEDQAGLIDRFIDELGDNV